MRKELKDVVKSLKNYMNMEEASGMIETSLRGLVAPSKSVGTQATQGEAIYEDKTSILTQLDEEVKICKDCDLCSTRRNTVFGEGNINASLVFVGEAPGMEEDIQGRPFVGAAGQLLNKMIQAIGLKREDVYIANCLKCRPPKNRTPLPSELIACRNHLTQQINTIKPSIICCLGRPASQNLLMSELSIGKLRGKFYDYNGIKLMPTFHPAYLLRTPADKRLAWEDFKKIRDALA